MEGAGKNLVRPLRGEGAGGSLQLGAESYGEMGCVVAWVQRLGKVSAAARQDSVSLAASTEQGGISGG